MLIFLMLAAAAAAPGDGKTTALDDWHMLSITGVSGDADGTLYLRVQADDLDGDGKADDAVLKLACAAGALTSVAYVIAPRDSASGMATGKRNYAPVKITKDWRTASPELQKIRPQYDVKTLKGNERAADGWSNLALRNADGLCPAAQAAIVKSKSNITNN